MGRSAALNISRQVAFFVESGDKKALGVWTEYELNNTTRSHIVIQQICRMLFPGDKICFGIKHEAYEVPYGKINEWLRKKGYQTVGPDIDTR